MYSIRYVYERLKDWANKNATNQDVIIDESRAVWALNEAMNSIVSTIIRNGRNDELNRISVLLVSKKLNKLNSDESSDYFELKDDYFFNSSVKCKSNKCDIDCHEIKSDNQNMIFNSNFTPSIVFQETIYYLEGNKIRIFKDGFNITECTHTYYRKPRLIDLNGYERIDGSISDRDIDFEFNNDLIDEILIKATENLKIKNN